MNNHDDNSSPDVTGVSRRATRRSASGLGRLRPGAWCGRVSRSRELRHTI